MRSAPANRSTQPEPLEPLRGSQLDALRGTIDLTPSRMDSQPGADILGTDGVREEFVGFESLDGSRSEVAVPTAALGGTPWGRLGASTGRRRRQYSHVNSARITGIPPRSVALASIASPSTSEPATMQLNTPDSIRMGMLAADSADGRAFNMHPAIRPTASHHSQLLRSHVAPSVGNTEATSPGDDPVVPVPSVTYSERQGREQQGQNSSTIRRRGRRQREKSIANPYGFASEAWADRREAARSHHESRRSRPDDFTATSEHVDAHEQEISSTDNDASNPGRRPIGYSRRDRPRLPGRGGGDGEGKGVFDTQAHAIVTGSSGGMSSSGSGSGSESESDMQDMYGTRSQNQASGFGSGSRAVGLSYARDALRVAVSAAKYGRLLNASAEQHTIETQQSAEVSARTHTRPRGHGDRGTVKMKMKMKVGKSRDAWGSDARGSSSEDDDQYHFVGSIKRRAGACSKMDPKRHDRVGRGARRSLTHPLEPNTDERREQSRSSRFGTRVIVPAGAASDMGAGSSTSGDDSDDLLSTRRLPPGMRAIRRALRTSVKEARESMSPFNFRSGGIPVASRRSRQTHNRADMHEAPQRRLNFSGRRRRGGSFASAVALAGGDAKIDLANGRTNRRRQRRTRYSVLDGADTRAGSKVSGPQTDSSSDDDGFGLGLPPRASRQAKADKPDIFDRARHVHPGQKDLGHDNDLGQGPTRANSPVADDPTAHLNMSSSARAHAMSYRKRTVAARPARGIVAERNASRPSPVASISLMLSSSDSDDSGSGSKRSSTREQPHRKIAQSIASSVKGKHLGNTASTQASFTTGSGVRAVGPVRKDYIQPNARSAPTNRSGRARNRSDALGRTIALSIVDSDSDSDSDSDVEVNVNVNVNATTSGTQRLRLQEPCIQATSARFSRGYSRNSGLQDRTARKSSHSRQAPARQEATRGVPSRAQTVRLATAAAASALDNSSDSSEDDIGLVNRRQRDQHSASTSLKLVSRTQTSSNRVAVPTKEIPVPVSIRGNGRGTSIQPAVQETSDVPPPAKLSSSFGSYGSASESRSSHISATERQVEVRRPSVAGSTSSSVLGEGEQVATFYVSPDYPQRDVNDSPGVHSTIGARQLLRAGSSFDRGLRRRSGKHDESEDAALRRILAKQRAELGGDNDRQRWVVPPRPGRPPRPAPSPQTRGPSPAIGGTAFNGRRHVGARLIKQSSVRSGNSKRKGAASRRLSVAGDSSSSSSTSDEDESSSRRRRQGGGPRRGLLIRGSERSASGNDRGRVRKSKSLVKGSSSDDSDSS